MRFTSDLVSESWFSPRTKLGPRKWRICATVGSCGVGASGSTVAMTNPSPGKIAPRTPK